MKKFIVLLVVLAAEAAVAVPAALAASDANGTASLNHVGLNPSTCSPSEGGPVYPGTASGVVNVHYNTVQSRFMVNLSVHDALPNTTYVLDIRCFAFGPQNELGTLTTDTYGTGTAQFTLNGVKPVNPFYIDISVKHGGGGAFDYGDTFIAGPFNLAS